MARIANYEKQLVKGTINMTLDRNMVLDESEIEYMVSKYTGNMSGDHRYDLEQYVKKEIEKAMSAR